MDMVRGPQIAEAGLADWRKLAQGLHARFLVDDFGAAARFVAAVGKEGDEVGHHPRARIGSGHVDLELVTTDAVYRDDEGTEHVVEWVTQQDVDLARRVSEVAAAHGLRADPTAVSEVELGLDVAQSATVAPVWAALLTGDASAQGRGTPSDEVRDATVRVPNLWFGDVDSETDAADGPGPHSGAAASDSSRQRFHVEVYVAPEVVAERVEAAVAAGATIVDDSESPGLTVLADPEGNRGVVCADTSAAPSA
ncbi:4a-hydroxytetrahydrobiopterin dehydratase [Rothia sp. ARF10]|nr:4a-hydroxytetrahydrobiopterin dehydratase [Rothia sp. ARF10]